MNPVNSRLLKVIQCEFRPHVQNQWLFLFKKGSILDGKKEKKYTFSYDTNRQGGFPIEIETQISLPITYSLAIFIVVL